MATGPRHLSNNRFHHEKWLRSAAKLLSQPDPGPPPFCVQGLIVEGSICVIQGRHKVGKTWVVLDLILAMVGARPAFGEFSSPKPGRVMAVSRSRERPRFTDAFWHFARATGSTIPPRHSSRFGIRPTRASTYSIVTGRRTS